MAAAWIAGRTSAVVDAIAAGHGGVDRRAIERLLRELRAGRLTAWERVAGKLVAISPKRWGELEPVFDRKRFLPGFAEEFGQLVVAFRDGSNREFHDVTISSEAMQRSFPADAPANVAPKGRIQARRDRARKALKGRFGDKIPTPAEMSNRILYKEATNWLAEHDPLPKGYNEVSLNTLFRAAGRRK